MKREPLVSVIVPVFNAGRYVRQALESILTQSYRNLEIIICDDASTDKGIDIIRNLPDSRIRIFRNEINQGYLRCVNFLVSKSHGDFLCFQDADDYSHPQRIRLQVDALLANVRLGLVGSNYAITNSKNRILRELTVEANSTVLKSLLEVSNPFQKPSILFRREVYKKVGMYREGFLKLGNISEDFDWILRASEHFEVGNVNYKYPLYFYRSVPTAMSKHVDCIDQLFGEQVAIHLYRQRLLGQVDSLEAGDFESLKNFIAVLRKPFVLNRSLFHHKRAEALMYSGLHRDAIGHAYKAVMKEPFKWVNYKLLQYCLRKTFFQS